MIVWIVLAASGLLVTAFALMPDLPETPQVFLDISDLTVNFLNNFLALCNYLFSPLLFRAFLLILVLYLAFEPIYYLVMWILRKIPVLGIK